MKKALLLAASLLTFSACDGDGATAPSRNVKLGETFDLRASESAAVADELLVVTFDRVSSDSRCPLGVLCIRAGEGVVQLDLRRLPSNTKQVTLKTDPVAETEARFEGYEVQLLELLPHPVAGESIPAGDYVARLSVRRP
jgi:hypothetical protein